jgi:hemerythrin
MMLQGGSFANLAEFPVLQMLYNQGMIIPGHPNNTGEKPLLIGLPDQIDAQLNYIHRGNYGLLSKDELRAAGASEEKARELMRIKLSFAFGTLRPISELLDSLAVDHKRMEIRNSVFLHRTGLNKYRIDYDGDSVDVDMELARDVRYASAYPLAIRETSREFFSVIHSGDGDGWDIDRPCMSSVVSLQGRLYLIDAGPNLENILNSLSISVNELAGIFHTHSHDDHFCGLSALLHADHKLTHFATPVVRASIAKKFSALLNSEDDLFESFFDCVDLEPEVWNTFDGFDVYPIESPHPVETTAFQFRVLGPEGYRNYAHLADITAQSVLNGMVTEDDVAPGITAAFCTKIKELYGARADLKKIDIGGGLIHGDSADFADDQSGKIVFSHLARPLTAEEKQVGSGADFGAEDVLIPNIGLDYFQQIAVENLRAYFPAQSLGALQILLNNEIKVFNPHEILIWENQPVAHVVLVVSGNVERFKRGQDTSVTMSAGCILGELSVLKETDAFVTYRATSYVRALLMPVALYRNFVDGHGERDHAESLGAKRLWLRRTRLFGDGLAYATQNYIASKMNFVELLNGPIEAYGVDHENLYLIEEGIIQRIYDDNVLETLGAGDVFNEGRSVFGWASKSRLYVIGTANVWRIPKETMTEVPILMWKFYEQFRRRIRLLPVS